MPAKVLLTIVKGPLTGTKYRFDEQLLCMIGRAESCMLQLTGDAGSGVSRHHCLLDVRPPQAFLCDLNSRNGTYLNQERLRPDTGSHQSTSPTRSLTTGDVFRVGQNSFEVTLIPAVHCCICHREMPDECSPEDALDQFKTRRVICADCLAQGKTMDFAVPSAKTILFQTCSVCGARIATSGLVSGEAGQRWSENSAAFICKDCLKSNRDHTKTFRMPDVEARGGSNMLPIKNYRVLKLIGRGGMGAVYLAESTATLEKVALKILLPEVAGQEQCREDFIREANNLKRLRHPNIVELKECDYTGGALYLALEYCTEGTLREFMARLGGVLPVQTAVELICQVLDGLEYAHNVRLELESLLDAQTYTVSGLVHRDIKPANIFLTRQDGSLAAKISDFGLAKAFDMAGISGCTRTGDFSGTIGFIPKQQFLNYKYVKPEVDVWAAAATLYYMLTGKPPRRLSANMDILRVFGEPPTLIRQVNPDIPERLAAVIDKALDDGTTLAFKSADQLKFALQDAIQ